MILKLRDELHEAVGHGAKRDEVGR
jgi:hypothetical protein